jgi:hypothetical protein
MSTSTWHAPAELLATYSAGGLDAVLSASLERHLDVCSECRARMRGHADVSLLDAGWSQVRSRLDEPATVGPLRMARRLGLPDSTAVLLSAAASLRTAWLTGSLVALGFALVATLLGDGGTIWPFLLVAPLVPVLGVAAAYGGPEDPFEALAVTTPYGRGRLVLVRTAAVVVSTLPPAALLGLFVQGPPWVAAAWLGPALAMVPIQLALSAYVGPWPAAAMLTLLWTGIVLMSIRRLPATWPLETTQQLAYLVLATAAVVVLLVRSHRTRKIGAAL